MNRRRQVKDVDFGLVFPAAPAPLQPVSSNRRTPQPEIPPQRSTRRTPVSRRQPGNIAGTEENNAPIITHSANDANISAKRRKLDTDAPPSSGRSTRSSQNIRPDIYTLNDDEQQELSVMETSNVSIEEPSFAKTLPKPDTIVPLPSRTARTPSFPAQMLDEVTESPMDAPGSGHRTSVSILEATIASSHLQAGLEGSAEIETPLPQNLRKRKRGKDAPRPTPRLSHGRRGQASSPAIDDLDDLDELSPEQSDRRGRGPRIVVEHSPELEEPSIAEEAEEEEEAEAINDEEAAALLKKNRGRRISRNVPTESPDLDSPELSRVPVAKKQKGKARPDLSPVKQKHNPPRNPKFALAVQSRLLFTD